MLKADFSEYLPGRFKAYQIFKVLR